MDTNNDVKYARSRIALVVDWGVYTNSEVAQAYAHTWSTRPGAALVLLVSDPKADDFEPEFDLQELEWDVVIRNTSPASNNLEFKIKAYEMLHASPGLFPVGVLDDDLSAIELFVKLGGYVVVNPDALPPIDFDTVPL